MVEAVAVEVPLTFEEFVAAHGRALWRSAWLLTGDAERAEDLVQTALVKCWRRWDQIALDGSVEGYVRRALITTYTDWRRRKWTGELPTADVLGVSVGTVKSQTARALKALRATDLLEDV